VVIDYGASNLFSITKALEKTGLYVTVTNTPKGLKEADALILPGVGNFGPATKILDPLRETITQEVKSGKILLGSCLGLQLLFEDSEESPGKGLGLIKGRVKKFNETLKIPHMGWNSITQTRDSPLLDGISDGSYFYFVHSYYPEPENTKDTLAITEYNQSFTSIVEKKNIYGTQFHPEKSGTMGAHLLENFVSLVRK
jgi:glutamine amidotransferase